MIVVVIAVMAAVIVTIPIMMIVMFVAVAPVMAVIVPIMIVAAVAIAPAAMIVVTITVLPDMLASATKKAPPPKKGRKGGDATPIPTTSTPPAEQLKKLGEERMAVVKNLMRQQGISTTRLVWDVKPGVEIPPPPSKGKFAGYPDNVTIKITSFQEPEDDDQ